MTQYVEQDIMKELEGLVSMVQSAHAELERSGNIDLQAIENAFNQIFLQLDPHPLSPALKSKLSEFQVEFKKLGDILLRNRDVLSAEVKGLTSHEKGLKAYTHNAFLSSQS